MPLLDGRPNDFAGHHHLYWEKRNEQGIRMGPWKACRPHPDKPVELFLIEEDTHSERDLAAYYPDIVHEVERLMVESRVDHPWYHNPGETEEQQASKRRKAEELGQLQVALAGNTTK